MITTNQLLTLAQESANNDGDASLADKIHVLLIDTPDTPPFDPPYSERPFSEEYMIPSGQYHGRFLRELGTTELQSLYAGFHGCGYVETAGKIKAEIERRIAGQ